MQIWKSPARGGAGVIRRTAPGRTPRSALPAWQRRRLAPKGPRRPGARTQKTGPFRNRPL